MDAIQHKVISLLEGLSSLFPSMSFTYGYDPATQQHLVNVEPEDMYSSDEYMMAEGDVYYAWDAAYPDDDLVFVSNNPHHKVFYPLHTITGAMTISKNECLEPVNEPLLIDSSDAPHPTIGANELFANISSSQWVVVFGKGAVQQVVTINKGELNEMEAGEYNYAMAA